MGTKMLIFPEPVQYTYGGTALLMTGIIRLIQSGRENSCARAASKELDRLVVVLLVERIFMGERLSADR
jgi:hypothetical protein